MKKYLLAVWLLGFLGTYLKGNTPVPTGRIDSLFQLGVHLCDEKDNFVEAKAPIAQALSLVDSVATPQYYLDILDKYIKCHYRLYQSEEASRLALRGYDLATQLELPDQRIRFIQWLGRAVEIEGRWEDALRYYGRVLELAEKGDDRHVRYDAQLNLAVTHYKSGDVTTGLALMEDCEHIVRQMGSPANLVADNLLWRGIMYRSRQDLQKALSLFRQALPVFDSTGVLYRQTHVRMEMAQVHLDLGAPEESIKLVEEAFAVAGHKMTNYDKMYGNDLLYRANLLLERYEQALGYRENWYEIRLALKEENDSRELQELTRTYELNEQRSIIQDQQKELEFAHYSSVMWSAVGGLFVLLCGVLVYFLFRFNTLNNKLRSALKYQELLRGEVHHRVSNNLQLIISLLDLHQTNRPDQQDLQLLQDISGKVYTIASVHQMLYQRDGVAVNSFEAYLRNLAVHWRGLWGEHLAPNFVFDLPDLQFNQDTLVPLGMMLNELVVNTRKYATGEGEGDQLNIQTRISVTEENQFVLTYRDNGPGFPEEVTSAKSGNLGFHILRSMSRQLNGSVAIHNDQGAVTVIHFRKKNNPSLEPEERAHRRNFERFLGSF